MIREYYPLENSLNAKMPKFDSEVGPWRCGCGAEDETFADFLEIHLSGTGTGIVFRISRFSGEELWLGECVVLQREDSAQVAERILELGMNISQNEPCRKYDPILPRNDGSMPEFDTEVGPWRCVTTRDYRDNAEYLEVSRSKSGESVVFRVNSYACGRTKFGECAILQPEIARYVLLRLENLIDQLPK